MEITIRQPQPGEDESIVVNCHQITPEIMRLLNAFKSLEQGSAVLIGYNENEISKVDTTMVFYIETVDNKCFLYCEQNVYESKQKLYELEEILSNDDFLRVSKSAIINLSKVKSLAPALYGRMEAILSNGEKMIISRQYVGELKKNLGL